MTYHSSLRYGGGRAFCDNGSCAKSGPVRVRYFDPDTGEPLAERPKGRRGKRRDKPLSFEPGSVPPCAVAVTVDGTAYESIAEAARRERVSPHTLRMARKMGWTRIGKRYVSFA